MNYESILLGEKTSWGGNGGTRFGFVGRREKTTIRCPTVLKNGQRRKQYIIKKRTEAVRKVRETAEPIWACLEGEAAELDHA